MFDDLDIDDINSSAKANKKPLKKDEPEDYSDLFDFPAPFYEDLEREESELSPETKEKRGEDYHFKKLMVGLSGKHAARMHDLLSRMKDNQFRITYMALMEYALPKLSRVAPEFFNEDNEVKVEVSVQARDGSESIEIADEINTLNAENESRRLNKPKEYDDDGRIRDLEID